MKFGKLIEYNIRNTFLEKPQGKYGVGKIQCGETSSRPFSNSQELLKYIKTKVLIACFCLNKDFLRNKKRFGTGLPVSFSALFLKEGIVLTPKSNCLIAFAS